MAQDTARVTMRSYITSPVTGARPAPGAGCPSCGKETLSLSLVLKGAQNGQVPLGLGGAAPNQETIARWLRPPDVPGERPPVSPRDIWGPPFAIAILVFVSLLASVMIGAILGYVWSIPIAIVLMAYGVHWVRRTSTRPNTVISSSDHERALALRAWDRRMEVWERLCVCPHCGLLSDPVTGRTAEWHSVPSLFV